MTVHTNELKDAAVLRRVALAALGALYIGAAIWLAVGNAGVGTCAALGVFCLRMSLPS